MNQSAPTAPSPSTARQPPLRAILIEDHPVVRKGLIALLSESSAIEVVGEAESGTEGLALYREARPDVAIVDLKLPGISGTQTIEEILREFPQARCVILSTFGTGPEMQRAFEAGARAYLLKGASCDEIVETLRTVHQGRRLVPPAVAERLLDSRGVTALSPRELEVLRLAARGLSNKLIGVELKVTEGTVKTHMARILAKMNCDDRTGAVVAAIRLGLIEV